MNKMVPGLKFEKKKSFIFSTYDEDRRSVEKEFFQCKVLDIFHLDKNKDEIIKDLKKLLQEEEKKRYPTRKNELNQ